MTKNARKPKTESAEVIAHAPLTIIEVADGGDLSALLATPAVGSLIALRLSDTVAIATPQNARALIAALRKAGHTPRVVSAQTGETGAGGEQA